MKPNPQHRTPNDVSWPRTRFAGQHRTNLP